MPVERDSIFQLDQLSSQLYPLEILQGIPSINEYAFDVTALQREGPSWKKGDKVDRGICREAHHRLALSGIEE